MAAVKSVPELLNHLDKLGVTRVFMDLSIAEAQRPAHLQLLQAAMQSGDKRWKLSFEVSVMRVWWEKGPMLVFQRS